MSNRDWGPGDRFFLALVLVLVCTGSVWAQSPTDTTERTDSAVVQETFAQDHLRLDRDGLATPGLGQQYEDEHRPTRSLDTYRKRHARRHPKLDHDGELHVSQYQPPA